jgi:hypothetical protein
VEPGNYTVAASIATQDFDSLIKVSSGQQTVFIGNPTITVTGKQTYNHIGLFGFGLAPTLPIANVSFGGAVNLVFTNGNMYGYEFGTPAAAPGGSVIGLTVRDTTISCGTSGTACGLVYIPQRANVTGSNPRQVQNVLIENNSGIFGDTLFDAQDVVVQKNKLINKWLGATPTSCDGFDITAGLNVTFRGNQLYGFAQTPCYAINLGTLDATHTLIYGINGVNIDSNDFYDCPSRPMASIFIAEGPRDAQGIQNVHITNNRLHAGCNGIYANPSPAASASVPWGPFVISSNTISGSPNFGVWVQSAGGGLQNCAFTISGNQIVTTAVSSGAGIYFANSQNCGGISNSAGAVITGNAVTSQSNSGAGYNPIYVNLVQGLLLSGNTFTSHDQTTASLIKLNGLYYSTLKNNYFGAKYTITEALANTNEFAGNAFMFPGTFAGKAMTRNWSLSPGATRSRNQRH